MIWFFSSNAAPCSLFPYNIIIYKTSQECMVFDVMICLCRLSILYYNSVHKVHLGIYFHFSLPYRWLLPLYLEIFFSYIIAIIAQSLLNSIINYICDICSIISRWENTQICIYYLYCNLISSKKSIFLLSYSGCDHIFYYSAIIPANSFVLFPEQCSRGKKTQQLYSYCFIFIFPSHFPVLVHMLLLNYCLCKF